jgi:hypothetical protein
MSATTASTVLGAGPTTKQKVGLAIAGLYALSNIPSVLFSTPEGETGPPLGIMVVCSILGVVGVVGAVVAWRGSPLALRITAGAIIVITLTSIPAFFVDIPTAVKFVTGLAVLITVAAVALMFSGRRPGSVVD